MRYQKRQNQTRRRATTSSSRSFGAVDPEQARPLDEPAEEQVEAAAEGEHRQRGGEQRPADRPAFVLVEQDEEGGAGEDGDGRGRAPQRPPLVGELPGLLARSEPSGNRSGRHFRSVDVTKLTYFDVNASDLFAADEIERARRYHRPLYLALGADLALQLAVLAGDCVRAAGRLALER